MVAISDGLEIPDEELQFTTSRSSGPGGQNVNKVNTRVTLLFDVDRSPSLTEVQRRMLHERLGGADQQRRSPARIGSAAPFAGR